MLDVADLALCPCCGSAPEFLERDLPTGTHASCKFVCTNAECGFRGPGIAQRLGGPGGRELHRAGGPGASPCGGPRKRREGMELAC